MISFGKRVSLAILLFVSLGVVSQQAVAIPAFARKYGLPCSACHEAWPKLNNFGQVFRDNGYQLMNDRDSPIYQNPSYFPITIRMTPNWHHESQTRQQIDSIAGDGGSPQVETTISQHGFDLSGIDLWTAGTLYKNISFTVLPSADSSGAFHFEAAFVRFDNLAGSRWLNLKFGKFELDNFLSEKRFLTLSQTGGFYYNYHFAPAGSINTFGGIGDNQLGMELAGHSWNSYTRYSVSLLSSNDGTPGLPTSRSYDAFVNLTQAFEIPRLGLQHVGVYGYFGQSPTYFQTNIGAGGGPLAGTGIGNKSFARVGAYGQWYIGKFDLSTFYMHGQDNVFLGNGVAANRPDLLPAGAVGPTWNGGFLEAHYSYNPQLIFIGRYELVKMSRQANPGMPSDLGNVKTFTLAYRWYPIMFSRAGLAWHQEYARATFTGTAPISGLDQTFSSFFSGFDFDF